MKPLTTCSVEFGEAALAKGELRGDYLEVEMMERRIEKPQLAVDHLEKRAGKTATRTVAWPASRVEADVVNDLINLDDPNGDASVWCSSGRQR